MVVEFDGRPHNVIMVNDCRARIVSAEKKTVVVTDSRTGKESSFQRAEAGINISPESPLKILSYTKQK